MSMKNNQLIGKISNFLNESKGNYKGVEPYKHGYKVEGSYKFTGKLDKPLLLVTGDCEVDKNVTSLEGCPEHVCWNFDCSGCDKLTSLEGGPKYVGGDFNCSECDLLKSLKGGPETVNCDFDCSGCKSLISLEGAPSEAYIFCCSNCKSLISLKGAPRKVGDFDCSHCESLISLEGCPKEVEGSFACFDCDKLTVLDDYPKCVGNDFYYSSTLDISPSELSFLIKIGREISCGYGSKSIEYKPKESETGDYDYEE